MTWAAARRGVQPTCCAGPRLELGRKPLAVAPIAASSAALLEPTCKRDRPGRAAPRECVRSILDTHSGAPQVPRISLKPVAATDASLGAKLALCSVARRQLQSDGHDQRSRKPIKLPG